MRRLATAMLLGWAVAPPALLAQGGGLAVLVLDQDSRPIEGAQGQVSELVVTTGADGMMYFPGLPPGRWQLTTRYIGYQPDIRDIVVLGQQPTRVVVKLVPAPLRLPPVVVEATRPGLYGIVSTTRLEPIAGAEVQLVGRRGRAVPTDSAGHFMLPEAVGPYLVYISADGYRDRRFSVEVPSGKGQELLLQLDVAEAGYRGSGNMGRNALRDLSFRMSWASPLYNTVLTREVLARYGTGSVCEVPQVSSIVNSSNPRGVHLRINGYAEVGNLCGVRADEVEVVEAGRNACAGTLGRSSELLSAFCRSMPEASGRAGQVTIRHGRQGPAYVFLWLAQ